MKPQVRVVLRGQTEHLLHQLLRVGRSLEEMFTIVAAALVVELSSLQERLQQLVCIVNALSVFADDHRCSAKLSRTCSKTTSTEATEVHNCINPLSFHKLTNARLPGFRLIHSVHVLT
jgi:hypothetical protein